MMNESFMLKILHYPKLDWIERASDKITAAILDSLSRKGQCILMLTGGNTAESLYSFWAKHSVLPKSGIRFLFGDERCVPPDHPDSNYGMVMRTLFEPRWEVAPVIDRMEGESIDREGAAKSYESILPDDIDVLLLGLGTDGHVASLFPNSDSLRIRDSSVLSVVGPNMPKERLTVGVSVILRAKSTFVLALGEEKGRVLGKAIRSNNDFISYPVCLTLNGTWVLDDLAVNALLAEVPEAISYIQK